MPARLRPAVPAAFALAGLLAACAPQTPRSHADEVTERVCRQRAEQVYALQNPNAPYAQDNYATSTRDAPFATSGVTGVTSQGLSDRYALQQLIGDCIDSTGGSHIGPTPAAPPPGPPASAAAPPPPAN